MSCLKSWNRSQKASCAVKNWSDEEVIEVFNQATMKAWDEDETNEITKFEWSKIDLKMKWALWKNCSQREKWHWLISLLKNELFYFNAKDYFIQMRRNISFKCEELFHSNAKNYFIQMRRIISFNCEESFYLTAKNYFIQMSRIISFKCEELFYSSAKNYFIQLRKIISFNCEKLFHLTAKDYFIQLREIFLFKCERLFYLNERNVISFKWKDLMIIFRLSCYRNCFLSQKNAWLIDSTSSYKKIKSSVMLSNIRIVRILTYKTGDLI